MDETTGKVRHMYNQYPFPNENYEMDYGFQIIFYFKKFRKPGQQSFLEDAEILDAGCGTGSVSIGLSKQFPNSKIVSLDLSENNLAKAKMKAEELKLNNIEFVQGNILNLDLKKKFDVIFNIGVLHHLSDPQKGIIILKNHLKDKGRLLLWLYGKYGRFRLNLNQRMLSILFKNVKELPKKVEYTKNLLKNGPQEFLQCHFNVANSKIEDDWKMSRDWILTKEQWIVDQFLHYNERVVNIEDILKLLDQVDLSIDKWIGLSQDISSYVKDKEIIEQFNNLSAREKLTVIDLLAKPNYYTIAVKKNNKKEKT